MIKKIATLIAMAASLSTQAQAKVSEARISECEAYAANRIQQHRGAAIESESIRNASRILGGAVAGRDLGSIAEGVIMGFGHRAANETRMNANRHDVYFNQCIREKRMEDREKASVRRRGMER